MDGLNKTNCGYADICKLPASNNNIGVYTGDER